MNAKADIVFFGDSLTYYGDFSSVFPDKVICNLGLRGDTIQGMIDRVEQVKVQEPKVVYLRVGINDMAICISEKFTFQYETLVIKLKENVPKANIIIQNLLPVDDKHFAISCNNVQIDNCNAVIKEIAKSYGLDMIDLHVLYTKDGFLPVSYTTDGIHLKSDKY